jgi:lambda family phage portal protein
MNLHRSRDLARNNSIGRAALKTLSTNVIGRGLTLQSNIYKYYLSQYGLTDEQANEWEDNTERKFKVWSKSIECDDSRRKNFYQLQNQAYFNKLQSGDVFVLMKLRERPGSDSNLKIKIIEADLVETPQGDYYDNEIRGGIKFNNNDEPITYYIYKKNDYVFKSVKAFGEKSGRKNILHIFDQDRPGQTRGIPILAPVIREIKQLGRYKDSELAAAVVASFYSVFIKSSDPDMLEDPMRTTSDDADRDSDIDYTMSPGAVIRLEDGEEIQTSNPGRPNQQFEPFMIAGLRDIAMALEMPLELFLKHFTSSFSASRAAMANFETYIEKDRTSFKSEFNQPIYEEWLIEEILSGRIEAPGYLFNNDIRAAYNRAQWIGPAAPQINQMVAVNSAIRKIENNLSTYQEETVRLTGGDFRTNARKLQNEKKLLGNNNEKEENEAELPSAMGGNSN